MTKDELETMEKIIAERNELRYAITNKKREREEFINLIYRRINEVRKMSEQEYIHGSEKLHYGWECRLSGLTESLDLLEKAKQSHSGCPKYGVYVDNCKEPNCINCSEL
jgi:hypothetical protein